MSELVRFGVVGYGPRGRSLFSLTQKVPGAVPAAVCEVDHHRLEEARSSFPEASFYEDFDSMLTGGKIDSVLVETPANNHATFCAKALDANIHVLSDVPCVFSKEEAEHLWQAKSASSASFMFGSNPNFWGFVEAACDAVKKGLLGRPYFLEAEYIHDVSHLFERSPWRATFPPIVYSTHSLGPLLRLIDEDLTQVSCFDTGSHVDGVPGRHDSMTAIFRTDSGVVVRITCAFRSCFRGGLHAYRVMGTKGCFERTSHRGNNLPARTLINSTELVGLEDITELRIGEARPNAKHADGHGGADYAMIDAFVRFLLDKTPNPLDLREGLRISLPGLFAAESAANSGQTIKIEYPWSTRD